MTRVLARSGLEAVGVVKRACRAQLARLTCPDAVLLDMDLRGYDGADVCSELRRAFPSGLTVLEMSASAVGPQDRVSGLDGEADSYLVKPLPPAEVVATLRAAMRARAEAHL